MQKSSKNQLRLIGGQPILKVISASRRIDMVGCYPDELVQILETRCPPERVHSLVIWTKNVANLLDYEPLRRRVLMYDQIYVHYTITGMGGSALESRVPPMEETLKRLPEVIELVGSPRRVQFRFDPIVHLRMPGGKTYTNLPIFKELAPAISQLGIEIVTTSWVALYRKVVNRLKRAGFVPLEISQQQWQAELDELLTTAQRYNLRIHGCCVPGLPRSRCIDGELLNKLHPKGYLCSTKRAKGQRELCGCTESWDIGWYNPCLHGCLYCYGNPWEGE
ncbi:MAG: DUF1848 domain-containing protein [candidate division KSB1 bacterium]|nr:DUF1848 domain-containing protein [candidate division KSB1 bacterium]